MSPIHIRPENPHTLLAGLIRVYKNFNPPPGWASRDWFQVSK